MEVAARDDQDEQKLILVLRFMEINGVGDGIPALFTVAGEEVLHRR